MMPTARESTARRQLWVWEQANRFAFEPLMQSAAHHGGGPDGLHIVPLSRYGLDRWYRAGASASWRPP